LIEEINVLIGKKHELIVRLDNQKNYDTDLEKENDLIRLGELEGEIREKTLLVINNKSKTIQKFDTTKINEMRDIRKIAKGKYENLRNIRDDYNKGLTNTRKRLEYGRQLMEKLVGHNPSDPIPKELEKIKEEILKW